MGKRCVILGAGCFDGLLFPPDSEDLLIAADGGYDVYRKLGLQPDVLIGDLDSLESGPYGVEVIRHPRMKDDTDMALAVSYAEDLGCREFYLYGSLGGRLDHTIANLQLLTGMSRRGLAAYLIGEGNVVTALTEGSLTFSKECSGVLSVFCMGDSARGVTERGLLYTLEDAGLFGDRPLGVSNEFIGQEGSVSVKEGTLVLIWDAGSGLPFRRIEQKGSPQ